MLILLPLSLSAQYDFTSGSGELKGTGGSASQSIGQIAYTTYQSDSGKVNQGVIQPYQISILNGEEIKEINLSFNAYPNPVLNILNLRVENYGNQALSYQLFDINGRLLQFMNINTYLTEISTSDYPPATYFLRVMLEGKIFKTFKIVKISF
jgi:hypothetical protein